MKITIDKLRWNENLVGIDVYTHRHGVIRNVAATVVECAVGSDYDYLLKTRGEPAGAFSLLSADYEDFLKFKGASQYRGGR